jgi:hypothetical protein
MEDLKQALRDFVATSNSGKYTSEAELLSKFPELNGYDVNVLRDFVATSNSGKYASEEELFSKFPEFGQPVKKKEEPQVLPWNQKPAQPKPKQEPALPFLESKPSGISLGSARVPETAPMFEAPPMRTPEEAQAIVEAPQTADSEQGWLLNTVSALDRGFAKNLIGNPVKGMGTLLEGATAKVFGGTGKGPISDALISFGNYYNNAIDELTPQDEDFKNSLTDQFGQAFGQVASLIMTGGISGAGKEGAAIASAAPTGVAGTVGAAGKQLASTLISPTSVSAGLSMGQAEFDRAKELGATDDQAFEAFYKNAAVGSVLEQIPVMQFLKRFNQSTAGGVTNYIKAKGVAGLTGGFEEMTTEVLQQLYANKTAQEIYNINQELLEGVGESGGVGFGVGFILNAMGARVKKLKKEGNTAQAQLIENQIENFESTPPVPPPTYSVNGIKIESPEVINQMIDNMDVTDLSNSNIEITNDPELSIKLQDKMVTSSIKEEVREANPNLDEETLDQITALEKERKKFEGKKTQSAKDKLASINSQIKTLQENAVQKPSTEEGVLRPEESQVGLQEVGEGDAKEQAPAQEVVQEEVDSKSEIERRRQEELDTNTSAGYGVIASDYLFTGGRGSMLSTDYLLQALTASFPFAGKQIDAIRNKYASKLGNISDDVNSKSYNDAIAEIRDAINTTYQNSEIESLFDEVLNNSTGFVPREGNRVSSRLEALNEEYQNKVNEKYDAELAALEQPKEAVTPDEEVAAALDRIEIPEDTEAVQPIVTPRNKAERKEAARRGDMVYHNFDGSIIESTREQYDNALKEIAETGAIENVFNYGKEVSSRQAPNELEIQYEPSLLYMKKEDADSDLKRRTKVEEITDKAVEAVSPATPVVEVAPKVSSKTPKAKSVPIPKPAPTPVPAPAPKPVAIKKGVQELFESTPELTRIGTPELYSQYIDTIFPDSKVKDIVYHGTDKKFDKFNTIRPNGMFGSSFTTDFKTANNYTKRNEQGNDYRVVPAILNINKPKYVDYVEASFIKEKPSNYDSYIDSTNDGINHDEYIVFEPEQIHILGSKQDIKGFKKFVTQPSTSVKAPAPAPAPKPVAVVSQPTTKAIGPEALRQEYIDKTAEVRLNKDKSRTPNQIEERVAELRAEYQKLKAEMTAPKPKAEAKPAPKKAAPEPKAEAKAEPVVSKKDQEAIKQLESEIEYQQRQIEDAIEEIGNTKYNLKEALAEIKKKRDALKGQKMSAEARAEAKEELDAEIEDAKEEHDTYLEEYNDQLSEAKKEKKKAETKLAKLQAKSATPVSVVQEEEPSYDDIKDLDPTDETALEKILRKLDSGDASLKEFGRGNLSSGMAIPLARAIIKALKVLVKTGITLQEAIKRVASENNLEAKDVVNMIKDLDKAQSPMAKLKSQIQNEVQSVKDGVRSANEAVEAIVKYFNFNAERGNLTRRDLGRVINAIAKVKDQKSLDKAADKIFAIIDKAKTDIVEVSSSKALVSQIKLEARAALGAKKDINQKRKDLSNVIKAMETTGKISAAKAKAILNKIGRVNLDNPASVDAFLDYVENVFEDAAYEVELAGINAKLAKARNNVNRKIGTAKNLTPILNRLFSIKPSLIPAEVFDSYKELIDMFGDSAAVLDLAEITEVTQQAQDILNQIDDQLSTVPALATKLFNYGNAVLTEDGALDYSATIEKMLADGTIDQAEYDLMRKYKSYILPRAVKIPKTKEELAEEKKVLVKQAKEAANEATISPLASDDEKKMASSIIKLSKTKAVEGLDNRQLENLLKIFENFKNGYFPAYANGINNDLIAAENAGFLSKAIAKAKMPTLAKLKLRITNKRKALLQRVKSTPLFNIDELFGDFKAKDIFNSIFNSLAQNQQRYTLELEKINQRLEDALNKIAKSYGNNENKIVESKMKMAIYRIQREFESNPGDPSVNPAIEYINETIKAIKGGNTNYSDEDANMLEKIAKDYSDGKVVNPGIDAKKLYDSFSPSEKEALKLFDEINKEIEGKAVFTGDVIRGDKVRLLNNYNHINVLPAKGKDSDPIADVMSKFDPKNVVSTKAKSLIERTGGAKPINFDVFSTVQRGAKFVLMDYYLTNSVRVARKTINTTRAMMEENGTLTDETNTILDVINDAVELALKSSLDQAAFNDSFGEQVIKEMAKTGYRAMLGGIPRATTELTSNMAYVAMVNPKEWFTGLNMMKIIRGGKAVDIMEAVGSKVISRVYGSDPLKGRMIDPSVLSKRTGIGESKLKKETLNAIATIHNNSTKRLKNFAELIADGLISTPDKIMMRPLWFGSFDKSFQDFAGKKPDYDKIEANDADYMIQNKEALEAAGRVADEKVTMAGNVENPYMNALKAYIASDQKGVTKMAKVFDNFMLKFQIGEYLTARRGLYALMGNGNISKAQGAKIMAAVVTRMTVYTVMSKMAAEFFYGLFLDDEDKDDDKSLAQKLGQGLASTFTSLFLGRDFGNISRSMINYGVEKANEKYLDFLRDGEYDPYEDAIQYSFIPPEKKGKSLEAFDIIANMSGPYSPAIKSLDFVTKKLTEEPKKEAAAIERQEQEKAVRVPLEILGNLGYVPFYKDIRAYVNKSIYSELDKELDEQGQKEEEFKPMGLNKSDLQRYYPEIYEQYYGEGTEDAARRKLEQEREVLERRMKDDYYNYVPKQEMKKSSKRKSGGIERRMRK